MTSHVVNINMDAKCAECGKPGATGSGICMGCVTKAMDPKREMKSHAGRVVQQRIAALNKQSAAGNGVEP